MASFQSTITEMGLEVINRFLAAGGEVKLTRAEAGSGIVKSGQTTRTELKQPADVNIQIGEKEFVESTPSYILLPVYISNAGLAETVFIREVGIYGLHAHHAAEGGRNLDGTHRHDGGKCPPGTAGDGEKRRGGLYGNLHILRGGRRNGEGEICRAYHEGRNADIAGDCGEGGGVNGAKGLDGDDKRGCEKNRQCQRHRREERSGDGDGEGK